MRAINRLATLFLKVRSSGKRFHFSISNGKRAGRSTVSDLPGGTSEEGFLWASKIQAAIDPSRHSLCSGSDSFPLPELARSFFHSFIPAEVREAVKSSDCEFLVLDLDPVSASLPWELCHDGTDYLGCRFSAGRHVEGWSDPNRPPPTAPGGLRSVLVVSNPTGDLPASTKEGSELADFLMNELDVDTTWLNHHVDCRYLCRSLGNHHLLHFSGHFVRPRNRLTMSGWKLSDGLLNQERFMQLTGPQDSMPLLIFNNACESAGMDEAGVEPASEPFFSSLIKKGCLHYVGGLSNVVDYQGREFAKSFYRHVLGQVAVGTALKLARLHTRFTDESDSGAWAQYVLYGDPRKGVFGDRAKFPEVRTQVFVESPPEELETLISGFPEAEAIQLPSGMTCLLFALPSVAVRFALTWMRCVREKNVRSQSLQPLPRLSISHGEVSVERMENHGEAVGIEGVSSDIGCLLLEAVQPGQILTTRAVLNDARAVLRRTEVYEDIEISWLDHGLYKHRDLEETFPICEVGETDVAPLSPPENSNRMARSVSPDQEPVLGWRPANDLEIPTSPEWILKEKLGEGGFGEVWRAIHRDDPHRTRVFKFCFKADRVRSLKREVTLFRILKERLGPRPDIVQIFDVYFEEPPFYISMEDVQGLDLGKWCLAHCQSEKVDESVRLEIVAKIADALQVAHDAGVIHRDVKPSNILIEGTPEDVTQIRVKLTDFGIGQVQSTQLLVDLTAIGFSETFGTTEMTSGSGSRLYMAPELLVGRQSSIRSDIYSLGVVLYQLLLRDCDRPLTVDWESDIGDPILLEDLRGCLAGEAGNRFHSAGELAERLRKVPERRIRRKRNEERIAREERRRKRSRVVSALATVATALVAILSISVYQIGNEREKTARQAYYGDIGRAMDALHEENSALAKSILYQCPGRFRGWEWGYRVFMANRDIRTYHGHKTPITRVALDPGNTLLATGDETGKVLVRDFLKDRILWAYDSGGRPIDAFDFDSSGTLLAISDGERLSIHEASTGVVRETFTTPAGFYGAVHFIPETSMVAATDSSGDILLASLDDRSTRTLRTGHTRPVPNFDVSRDGKQILTGSLDSWIRRISVATGKILAATIPDGEGMGPGIGIGDVEFSPDEESFYFAAGRFVQKRRTKDFRRLGHWHQSSAVIDDLAIDPHGFYLATKSEENSLELSLLEGRSSLPKWWDVERGPRSLVFTRDGMFLLVTKQDSSLSLEPVIKTRIRSYPLENHRGYIKSMAFRPDGKILATGTTEIGIWDTRIGENLRIVDPEGEMTGLAFAESGTPLAAVTNLGDVLLWEDPPRGTPRKIGDHGDHVRATGLDHSPTERNLATVGFDGNVKIWNVDSGDLLRVIRTGERRLHAVAYSPDGSKILTGGKSGVIREWNVTDGAPLRTFRGHKAEVRAIRFYSDGARFASGGKDRRILVWDYSSGETMAAFRVKTPEPFVLAISPDDRRLMSFEQNWDLDSFRLIGKTLSGVKAFSPDGRLLALGGAPRDARLVPAFPFQGPVRLLRGTRLRDWIDEYKFGYWSDRLDYITDSLFFPERVLSDRPSVTFSIGFDSQADPCVGFRDLETMYDLPRSEAPFRFSSCEAENIPYIAGSNSSLFAFAPLGRLGSYRIPTGTRSIGGKNTNRYTILMDLYYPEESCRRKRILFNTNPALDDSPELVVSATGALGYDNVFHGHFETGRWHRVCCAVDLSDPPTMSLYIDGVPVGENRLPEGIDGRWSIPVSYAEVSMISVFSHLNASQTAPGYVSSIQVRNYAMTAEEVALLGGATPEGISTEVRVSQPDRPLTDRSPSSLFGALNRKARPRMEQE